MGSPPTLDLRAPTAWLRRFARTTPGVVAMIAVAVAVGCIIAAVVCVAQLNARIAERQAVLDRSEPLAYSAQNLYVALSAADAAAASAFLAREIQTGPMRARYQKALADAASALSDATAGATDAETRTAMAESRRNCLRTRGWWSRPGPTAGRGFRSGPGTCGKRHP